MKPCQPPRLIEVRWVAPRPEGSPGRGANVELAPDEGRASLARRLDLEDACLLVLVRGLEERLDLRDREVARVVARLHLGLGLLRLDGLRLGEVVLLDEALDVVLVG